MKVSNPFWVYQFETVLRVWPNPLGSLSWLQRISTGSPVATGKNYGFTANWKQCSVTILILTFTMSRQLSTAKYFQIALMRVSLSTKISGTWKSQEIVWGSLFESTCKLSVICTFLLKTVVDKYLGRRCSTLVKHHCLNWRTKRVTWKVVNSS